MSRNAEAPDPPRATPSKPAARAEGTRDHHLLDRVLAGIPPGESPVRHIEHVPKRPARNTDWPAWADPAVVEALQARGTESPWQHQADGAEHVAAGRNVIMSTGTASGKSLAYQLPVLSTLRTERKATAVYLAPTKALGADQLRTIDGLDLDIRAATYDGDTPKAEREWVRKHGRWIFTNPDMLHHGVLSNHRSWASMLRNLRYIIVDECHTYRGVFGSHVALLLRRLRRIAQHYGAQPVFVLASATVADPASLGAQLTGLDCLAITEDSSPSGAKTVVLWEPPLLEEITGENGAPVRRAVGTESARITTDLVIENARTLAFIRSRRGVELTALAAQRSLSEVDDELAAKVAAYRGGYLPEDRRKLERALMAGELCAVVTTNALELGVDISGLDAVVVAGYPGTLASFWQQAGRAGRGGEGSLVVFIARDDPLDTYLVHHPPAVLDRPVEATVLDPTNPYVLEPHLACAAAEIPLDEKALDLFGGEPARAAVHALTNEGVLRTRQQGWYWTAHDRPHRNVELRGSGGQPIALVEVDTGRMLGTVDPDSACATAHPGAVYLHQGESFVVDELDLDNGLALVHEESPHWTTSPREVIDITILRTHEHQRINDNIAVGLSEVDVTSQVVGYLRKKPSGEVLDRVALDLPEQKLTTQAVWYTISDRALTDSAPGGAGLDPARIPGALHAAEHAAIGLLPLFATCDRWDVGGVSTALHADTGEATVFVHDGHPGGAGFADRGHAALVPWLTATREAIASCECPAGCPSCVQSPKCGNGNEPLDKVGAMAVLDIVLAARGRINGSRGLNEQACGDTATRHDTR